MREYFNHASTYWYWKTNICLTYMAKVLEEKKKKGFGGGGVCVNKNKNRALA
jgi:hypothetical protein